MAEEADDPDATVGPMAARGVRFRVTLSGREPITCAAEDGVLSAIVSLVYKPDQGREERDLHVGGIEAREHVRWLNAPLTPGDTVTIEVLPPGPGDPPLSVEEITEVDDPMFGNLSGVPPVAEVFFPHPPGSATKCRVAFVGVEPARVRRTFEGLRARYAAMWSAICDAVEGAHPTIGGALRDDPASVPLRITFCTEPHGRLQLAYGLPDMDEQVWLVLRGRKITQVMVVH